MKRAREEKPFCGVDLLREQMMNRSNRIQGQIAFQDGPTGLGMIVAKYPNGVWCTNTINGWICALIHPTDGLSQYRVSQKAYNELPMHVSPKLVARTGKGSHIQLETELGIIFQIAMVMVTEKEEKNGAEGRN